MHEVVIFVEASSNYKVLSISSWDFIKLYFLSLYTCDEILPKESHGEIQIVETDFFMWKSK